MKNLMLEILVWTGSIGLGIIIYYFFGEAFYSTFY